MHSELGRLGAFLLWIEVIDRIGTTHQLRMAQACHWVPHARSKCVESGHELLRSQVFGV